MKKKGGGMILREQRDPVHLITVVMRLFFMSPVSFPAQSGTLSSLKKL